MTSTESRQAYKAVTEEGKQDTQVRAILRYLHDVGAGTSHEIAAGAKLTAYAVSKRRGHILRCGLAREQLPRKCRVTGHPGKPIQLTEEGEAVLQGADMPDPERGRRELEVAFMAAAREVAEAWRIVPEPPPGIKRLLEAQWNLDHVEDRHRAGASAVREPWGSPRRVVLAEKGIWLRRNGDEVPINSLNPHHLRSAIEWCIENAADPDHYPLLPLLQEQARRGTLT